MRLSRVPALLAGSASLFLCLAAVSGCGATVAHLASRRRRSAARAPVPAGALPSGAALPQALLLKGRITGEVRSAYATGCGVYAGTGFAAVMDLALPGRVETLQIDLPDYQGPGTYRVGGGPGQVLTAQATLANAYSARSGWVTVAAGGTGGRLFLELRNGARPESASGTWSCSTAAAGYAPYEPAPGPTYPEALIATGAVQAQLGRAVVPGPDLVAGAPNCGLFDGSKFNLAMTLELGGQPYLLQVQVPQYLGRGWYYPALTASDLPIESAFATAELSREGSPSLPGRVPGDLWGGVGGDFSILSGPDRGRMFIRFLNRAGQSLILSGAWSC